MQSYLLRVILEPDNEVWRAYVSALEDKGDRHLGAHARRSLAQHPRGAQLVVEELLEDGQPLPTGVSVTDDPFVAARVD